MTLPQIKRDYIDTGKLRYVFRDLPLESIHKQAFKAHEAANCAGDQGQYWEMHDQLFAQQRKLRPADLTVQAETLRLEMKTFQQCLNSNKYVTEIQKDIQEAVKAGIRGTPTFLFGFSESNPSTVRAVEILRGAQPYDRFKQVIEKLLASKKQ